ncbi:MAG: RNA polymerase sigma factor [Saprospiraceae bacterium]|nr:RNA polymerase sigma factor [Saprospiraceae bacterium]
MNEANVDIWLEGCRKQDSECQRLLYRHFFAYALSIGLRYAASKEEAHEIVNDAFVKIFTRIDRYKRQGPFKTWLGRIVVHTAIDRYRALCRARTYETTEEGLAMMECAPSALDYLYHEDLVKLVQQLPAAYRLVFNLHVVEGHTHEEIADMLGIQSGTSKSNLAKAKEKLKRLILIASLKE